MKSVKSVVLQVEKSVFRLADHGYVEAGQRRCDGGAGMYVYRFGKRREKPCPYCWPDGECAENCGPSIARALGEPRIEDWPEDAPAVKADR